MGKLSTKEVIAIIAERKQREANLKLLPNGRVDLAEVIAIREGKREPKIYPDPEPGGVDLNKVNRLREIEKQKALKVIQQHDGPITREPKESDQDKELARIERAVERLKQTGNASGVNLAEVARLIEKGKKKQPGVKEPENKILDKPNKWKR